MSKHDIMKAYLEPQVLIVSTNVLNFNVSIGTPDTISFVTQYADKIIKNYLRLGAVKEYGFAIIITKSYSAGTDDLNLLAMNMADAFGDWIDAQNTAKNYPNFGVKCQVRKIESLQNMSNLSDIDLETCTAKYMLQCKVTYYEEV
jgi:hypothetical protein